MKGKFFGTLIISISILITGCKVRQDQRFKTNKELVQVVDKSIKDAAKQYAYFMQQIPANKFPRALDKKGKLITSGSGWWCSGFYPGTFYTCTEANKRPCIE